MAARGPRIVAVLALVLGACAPRVPPPDLSLEPGPLLAQVADAASQVQRVRGEARLRVAGEGARGTVTAFVAAEKPDRLRVESVDFFGNPAAVLVAAAGRLAIYDARERTFYRGAATPENLALLVPLPLSPEQLVAIVCGAPLLDGDPTSAEPGRGYVTLELREGARTQRLRVGPGAAVLWAATSGDLLTPDHQVRFEDFRDGLAAARFPMVLSLRSEAPKVELQLTWQEGVEPNAALDPGAFRLEPPAGARVFDLDAGPPATPPQLVPAVPEGPSGRTP